MPIKRWNGSSWTTLYYDPSTTDVANTLVLRDTNGLYTAPSATKLATVRTINGVNFDGTSNITITAVPDNTSVTKAKLSTTSGEIAGAWATQAVTLTNITLSGATSTCRSQTIGKLFHVSWYLSGGTPTATAASTISITLTGVTFAPQVQVCVYQGPLGTPCYAKTTASGSVITMHPGLNQNNFTAGASITGITLNGAFELS